MVSKQPKKSPACDRAFDSTRMVDTSLRVKLGEWEIWGLNVNGNQQFRIISMIPGRVWITPTQ